VKSTIQGLGTKKAQVENTIQNGVKRTLPESIADSFAIEDTIQNGVKSTPQPKLERGVLVENTIQNGVKSTHACLRSTPRWLRIPFKMV